jgi:cytochrome c
MGRSLSFTILIGVLALPVQAETPQDFMAQYLVAAKSINPALTQFDPQRGQQFYQDHHGGEWNCASCHTEDPKAPGKHAETQKPIEPLTPSINLDRFRDPAKVEKWFKRSCKDILGRECSPQEKGDFLAYLLSVK